MAIELAVEEQRCNNQADKNYNVFFKNEKG